MVGNTGRSAFAEIGFPLGLGDVVDEFADGGALPHAEGHPTGPGFTAAAGEAQKRGAGQGKERAARLNPR